MRRGPTALAPSPLAGEGGGEGKEDPISPLWPILPRRHARVARANEKREGRRNREGYDFCISCGERFRFFGGIVRERSHSFVRGATALAFFRR